MKLFDLDGTLIDSNGIWVDVDLRFLGRHGLTPTEEYTYAVGHSIFPVAAEFTRDYYGLDLTPEAIMEEWLSMAGDAYAHVPMKEGARDYLSRCARGGERMAIVTACVPALCRTALERHGLTDCFEEIVFAQELGLENRDPQVYRIATERLRVSPGDCTLYEDAPSNCAAARLAGMTVVGVYDAFYDSYQEEMRKNSDRYIRSFTELL